MMWIDIYQVTVKVRLIHADLQPFLQYLRQTQFQFLFVRRFILVLTKFSFPGEGKGMGNNSMELWDFPDISFFSCVGILPASRRKFAKILSRDADYIYQFITNNHASFHLLWKKNLLKHQKVSTYYEHGCSSIMTFNKLQ